MMQSTMAEVVTTGVLGAPPPVGGPSSQPLQAPGNGAPGGGGQPGGMNPMSLMLPLLLLFVVMMIFSGRAAKREKKKRAEMLGSLGRHDRVQTAGGMIGTIVEIKDDEVVLKVDENTNTRIRFTKSSVTGVLRKGKGGGSSEQSMLGDAVEAK